jgi:predicted transcriptional regulator
MKSVLISIQPKWVEKIASGEKTIEVRKTRPKLEVPFKCYIYCTKGKDLLREVDCCNTRIGIHKTNYKIINLDYCTNKIANGKIIGEFVCDRIIDIPYTKPFLYYGKKMYHSNKCSKEACLSYLELENYLGDKDGYGWHISDLKIYDKPILLEELGVDKAPQSWRYI